MSITSKRLDWAGRLRRWSADFTPLVPAHSTWCSHSWAAKARAHAVPRAVLPRQDTRTASLQPAATARATRTASAAPQAPIAVGDVLELECQRLGFGGKGICLANGMVVMVERALPGEQVQARITAVRKGYAEAAKVASLKPHADAVEPQCPHFGTCGGCTLQNLEYSAQLAHKADHVQQLLARVGRVAAEQLASICREPVGAPPGRRYGYRNKVQFTFGAQKWLPGAVPEVVAGPALGFLRPGSNSVVLPITECHLQHPTANAILSVVGQEWERLGLDAFDAASGRGVMRHLIIRSAGAHDAGSSEHNSSTASSGGYNCSNSSSSSNRHSSRSRSASSSRRSASSHHSTGGSACDPCSDMSSPEPEFMVVLVTTAAARQEPLQALADALVAAVPQVASVVWSIEEGRGPDAHSSTNSSNSRRSSKSSRGRAGSERPMRSRSAAQRLNGLQQASTADNDNASSSDGDSSGRHGRERGQSRHSSRALAIASSRVLLGRQQLVEQLCGLHFCISPHSFFQTNSRQAEALYHAVADAAGLAPGGTDVLLDLYCGTGTIGLSMAHRCAAVVGVDVTPSSIADARANAAANGINNATFICADLDKLLSGGAALGAIIDAGVGGDRASQSGGAGSKCQDGRGGRGGVDVVITDPARAGMSAAVVAALHGCGARRLVYVSCNAATLARDVERLCAGSSSNGSRGSAVALGGAMVNGTHRSRSDGSPLSAALGPGGPHDAPFKLVSVTPVDLFPHTDHIEVVAVLDRVTQHPEIEL